MMQAAVAQPGELRGGVLILDESGKAKSGEMSAGVGRQYNGRHHQAGVFLAYAKDQMWAWVGGALYLPEKWFTPAWAKQRQKAALPPQQCYQKKTDLGWQMIKQAQAAGIPFVAVAFDSGYGHEAALRDRCRAAGIEYYADSKGGTQVYFSDPTARLAAPEVSRTNWLQQHAWLGSELGAAAAY